MNGDISSINSRTCCCTWHSHSGAAKSGPQVYNMIPYLIPWFGVLCVRMSLSMYMLHHNPYLHYPYHLHDLDPHFDSLPSIRGGLNSLCPFFIVLLKSPWNKNKTIRNLHVKLQLRSHLTPRCAVEGVGGEAWMPCQKNVTKRLDGLMRKNS